jgi:hypothetical protein
MRSCLRIGWLAALAGAVLLMAPLAFAQETTGAIRGTVMDDTGTALAGAAVEAIGPVGAVSTMTDDSGAFRFPRVAAGDYVVLSTFEGYIDATAQIRVVLGEAVTVDFKMQRGFTDEINVYSDTVAIDFSESQTATSVGQREIDYLPRGRDFTDVVTYAAGAVDSNQAGGISIDGASGLENRYIVDGLDTTDPQIGDAAIPLRAEFMEEVQVKSAGYMAEFGGAMGGVINAVTRSGGNEYHGTALVEMSNNSWNGSARPDLEYSLEDPDLAELVSYPKDDEVRYDPGLVLSGPIVRDTLWFFGSYQPGFRTTERTVDWVSYAPDTYTQDYQVDFATLNLTANLWSSFLIKAGLNSSPYQQDGKLPNRDGRADLPDQDSWAPLGEEGERNTYFANVDWIASDSFVVSGRGGFFHHNVYDTGIPTYDLIHNYSTASLAGFVDRHPEIPPEAQNGPGWLSDNLVTNARLENIYERTSFAVDGTWYLQAAGDHTLKAGYQTEEIYNDVTQGYNADRILYYWDRSYTTTQGEVVTGPYGYFRLMRIATQGEVTTRNQALFVQDTWSVTPTLTLNLGLRSESEEVPNYGAVGPSPAIEFDWGEKLAPRIGFAWDLLGDSRWKLYGSYGSYYDVTKYEMPRGAFGGDKWVDYYFSFDSPDPFLNNNPECRTGDNTIFERPECGAGTFIELVDQRPNAVDQAAWNEVGVPLVDPDLKPMASWEAQVGVDHQLTDLIQVGARVVHKEVDRAIEDVGFLLPGVGNVYIIANPGEGVTTEIGDLPYAKPTREYDALELSFEKRFTDNWSLRAYYTLSRLWGNYSGLANSDENNSFGDPMLPVTTGGRRAPNVSRLYDVPGSMYDQNGELVYGRLATDRTHQLGAQFLYSFDFGLSVGLNQYIGSGTPISTIGKIPNNNFFYPYGRGDLGTTPWLTQTDLSLSYKIPLGRRTAMSFGLTVLNLFDEDTPTRMWAQVQTQDLPVTDQDFLTGFDYAELVAGVDQDVAYGLYDTYQAPRDVRLSFKLEF